MNPIFFTADTHYGHKRILELANRPFSSVEEMDEALIGLHNAVVPKNGIVYHLGDFAFTDHDRYLYRLNGEMHLIPGNHDHRNRIKSAKLWHTVHDKLHHLKVGDLQLVLCHYAMRTWRNSHHGALHFYGHSHGNLLGDGQSCDVGVDCWRMAPVSLDELIAHLSCFPDRREPDHHQPRAA